MNKPLVSIIIPCRNEADFIGRSLDSLLAQDYPKDKVEILVIDGASTDSTRKIADSHATKDTRVRLFDNPREYTPIGMNIGIENAKGGLITKSDAHTIYPPDYISKCVQYIDEYKADAVGGVTYNTPADNSLSAKAIVLVLGSPLGGGGAFRQGSRKPARHSPEAKPMAGGPEFTDTAFGICYRREVFDKVGLFNEKLIRSQDFDFNLRLTRAGGKILLAPDIELTYYPKQKTVTSFWRRNFLDGIWAILPLKYGSPIFKPRHLAPLVFVSTNLLLAFAYWPLTAAILALYFAAVLYFSLKIAIQEKNILLLPFLVLAFAARHMSYGLGSIIGAIKLLLRK